MPLVFFPTYTGDLFLSLRTMTASCAPYEISSPDDEQVDLDFLTQIAQITDGDDVGEDVLYTELIVPSPTKV